MEAFDLIVLGRQLTRIGQQVMRGEPLAGDPVTASRPELPAGAQLVLGDVFAHPGSSITEITARTGLPQSYVSESVTKLRATGMAQTSSDPADGRRTLVSLTARHLRQVAGHSARQADAALLAALGDIDDALAQQIMGVVAELAARLRPASPRSVVGQIQAARVRTGPAGA